MRHGDFCFLPFSFGLACPSQGETSGDAVYILEGNTRYLFDEGLSRTTEYFRIQRPR
jgi:hypothetical protein